MAAAAAPSVRVSPEQKARAGPVVGWPLGFTVSVTVAESAQAAPGKVLVALSWYVTVKGAVPLLLSVAVGLATVVLLRPARAEAGVAVHW